MDLRDLRTAHNHTQVNLAAKIGVAAETISAWERGRSFPSEDHRNSLADALGVEQDALIACLPANHRPPGPSPQTNSPLVQLREAAGMSRRDVATALQIETVTLRNWESGHKRPSWARLARLAAAYGLDVSTVNAALDHPHDDPPLTIYRKVAGRSVNAVATAMGVSAHTVTSWEQGQRRPALRIRAPYAKLLGVTPEAIDHALGEIETPWDLKDLRERAGYTQTEVAEEIGTHRQLISTWELGVHRPRPENIRALATLYGVDTTCTYDALEGAGVPAATLDSTDDPTWWMPEVV